MSLLPANTYVLLISVFVYGVTFTCISRAEDCPPSDTIRCDGIDFSTADTAPACTESFCPDYPEMAYLSHLEGIVVVDVWVTDTGDVCDVQLVKGVHPLLDHGMRKSAFSDSYHPATSNGQPVAGICRLSFEFVHDDDRWQRNEWPEVQLTTPLISDMGVVNDNVICEMSEVPEVPQYVYDDVVFIGEMSQDTYHALLTQVMPLLEKGESLDRVIHYLALPVKAQPSSIMEWNKKGDLAVKTCSVLGKFECCHKGRAFRFFNRDGEYVLNGVTSFIAFYD